MALYDALGTDYLIELGISVALGAFVFLLTGDLLAAGGRGLAVALLLAALLGPSAIRPIWPYFPSGDITRPVLHRCSPSLRHTSLLV